MRSSRAPWIIAAAFATVATYAYGALIAYGDADRDPNIASFLSVVMALLVVVAVVATRLKRTADSRLPVTLSVLALAAGAVGIAITALSG